MLSRTSRGIQQKSTCCLSGGRPGCTSGLPVLRLLIRSTDRTTRAHAPWIRVGPDGAALSTWAEVGRPQIHGYDMTCVAFLDRLAFASGADEKVVRVFNAPRGFAESLYKLGASEDELLQVSSGAEEATRQWLSLQSRCRRSWARACHRWVFPTRLSPKVCIQQPFRHVNAWAHHLSLPARDPEPSSDKMPTMNEEHISISTALDKVPTEAVLAASTLWPEVDKIYGHGYEVGFSPFWSAYARLTTHTL